ncbi:MAG: hypothetical protein KDE01_24935, partial [Caldilineaceae bacterium]|nr:hypothetical protein [Caldilineaceae bacterium]
MTETILVAADVQGVRSLGHADAGLPARTAVRTAVLSRPQAHTAPPVTARRWRTHGRTSSGGTNSTSTGWPTMRDRLRLS